MRRHGGELYAVNFSTEIGKDRCDGIDAASDLDIAKEIKRRQLGRRHLHGAGVRLALNNTIANHLQVLAEMESDPGSACPDLRQLPVRHDLEFHDCMMCRAVQLRSLEQADIIGPTPMAHERVNIPRRRRRLPGQVLRRHHHVESLSGIEQHLPLLKSCGRLEEGRLREAERRDRISAREGYPPLRLKGRSGSSGAWTGVLAPY